MQSVMINSDATPLEEEKCVSIGCENALLYNLSNQSAILQDLSTLIYPCILHYSAPQSSSP
jgi:hypothetical protein